MTVEELKKLNNLSSNLVSDIYDDVQPITIEREVHTPILPTEWNTLSLTHLGCTSICYGKGKFVAVGGERGYYSEDDGKTWVAITDLANTNNSEVVYGNGRFVCIGTKDSSSFYSLDGISWTAMTGIEDGDNCVSLIYGKDRFMCITDYGKLYYSTQGKTWNNITMQFSGSNPVLCYGNGKFICGVANKCIASTDGLTWDKILNLNVEYCKSMCYIGNNDYDFFLGLFHIDDNNDQFYVATPKNLIWKPVSVTIDGNNFSNNTKINKIKYFNDRFIAEGQNEILYALENGIEWFTMTGLDEYETRPVVASNGEKLIAIGSECIYYLIDKREEISYETANVKVNELVLELYNNRMPLYNKTGNSTNGAMTQAATTAALEEINNNFNAILGDVGAILDEINRTEV